MLTLKLLIWPLVEQKLFQATYILKHCFKIRKSWKWYLFVPSSLLTSFPLLLLVINGKRKKWSEEENGGKGMGTQTEMGNYSERLVFWEHGGTVSLWSWGKRLLRNSRSMKIRFLLWITNSLKKKQRSLASQAEGSLCKHLLSDFYFPENSLLSWFFF